MILFSPMEQYEIYQLFNIIISFNNINFYLFIVVLISIALPLFHNSKLVPNWWGILNESLYKTILSMVHNYIVH